MTRVAELVDGGVRAYTRGQLAEAERCWTEALAEDPENVRARSYLEVLLGWKDAACRSPASPPDPPEAGVSVPAPPREDVPRRTTLTWLLPGPPAGSERDLASPEGTRCAPPPGEAVAPEAIAPAQEAATVEAMIPPRPEAAPVPEQAVEGREPSALSDCAPSPWDEGPALAPAVVLGEGDGLDLATVADQSDLRPLVPEQAPILPLLSSTAPPSAVEIWMEGARELFALGDFSGSLEVLEKILKVDPSHEEARRHLQENESTLIGMYESKLGSRDGTPRLSISPEEVMWLNLDHRAGFLLAQIDGTVTYEDLFALSGLPRLDTARILASLLQEGVIRSA